MKLLFAAGDVGGARALLPVARLAADLDHTVYALRHGVFADEGEASWNWLDREQALSAEADAVLYATSVKDQAAMDVAAAAQARGIPLLHMLDNWSSYAARLYKADSSLLMPDIYAVMDQLAFDEACEDGVPAAVLAITGHPNLAGLAAEHTQLGSAKEGRPNILFVSEPALADSGPADTPGSRGYDEMSVARAFMETLAHSDFASVLDGAALYVAPHPRQDRRELSSNWDSLHARIGAQAGVPKPTLTAPGETRAALHSASHVVGMSSILLYEAWLLGRPVASLQPGLRGQALRSLEKRKGLRFVDTHQQMHEALLQLLMERPGPVRDDLYKHQDSATTVLGLLHNRLGL